MGKYAFQLRPGPGLAYNYGSSLDNWWGLGRREEVITRTPHKIEYSMKILDNQHAYFLTYVVASHQNRHAGAILMRSRNIFQSNLKY